MTDDTLNQATGPLTPAWTSDGTVDPTVRYIDVATTKLYNDSLNGKPRGVRIDRGLTGARIRIPLQSSVTGAPLTAAVGTYSAAPVVQAVYTEATGFLPTAFEATGSLSTDGRTAAIDLPAEVSDCPGIYTAQFRIVDGAGVERERNEFWVFVDRGMWTSGGTTSGLDMGPPTTREIRNTLRDHPGANRLLGEYEFDVAELAMAVVSGVQSFHATFPPVPKRISTRGWPPQWRRPLLDAVLAYIFETAATYHRRGMLPYSAGNVTINDLSFEKNYLAAAQAYRDRFDKWAKLTKANASIAAAWGSTGSGYPGCATF